MKHYANFLTAEELLAATANGMELRKLADTTALEKQAQSSAITGMGSDMARVLLATSIITGVPIGILAHTVDRQVKGSTTQEKNLKKQITKYRGAAQSIEDEMVRQGVRR